MNDMYKLTYGFDADIDPEQQAEADRQTASLAGLAVAVLLVVVGLFLVQELRAESMIEDCLLAGQTQCVVAASSR
jgi:hypothetical protein